MSTLNQNQNFTNQNLSLIDKLSLILFKNKTAAIAIALVLVVASVGYYGWSVVLSQKENKAMDAYSLGEKLYQAGAALPDMVAGKTANAIPPKVDHSQAIQNFNKVLTDYSGTKASYLSALRLSDIYMQNNETEKTTQVLEPIVQKSNAKDFLVSMVALRLSGIYEKQQQCDKAVPVLQKITDQKSNPVLKPEAYLRLGLCFENLNQKDKAVEAYQKLTQEFSDSIQSQQAQKYLKLIKS